MSDPISLRRRNWVSFQTILRKEIVRFMRIWSQTLLPPAVQMVLYFLIFGKAIGRQINEMGDQPYISFLMPGLVMMSVISNSYANVVSSFFGSKFQKNIEEMLVSPTSNLVILTGYVMGGVARGLLVGLIVTLLSLFFTHVQIHNIAVTATIVLLTAILFSIGGFLNAVFAKKFDDVSIIPTFVLTPLTYLGGVFYSIEELPPFAQKLSLANPILYMVNAFRYGLTGHTDIPITVAFGVTLLFTLLLFGVAMYVLNRGLGLRS